MKGLRAIGLACGIGAVASLLLARAHPFGDAHLYAARTTRAPLLDHSDVPPAVRAVLTAKCADCHSMRTEVPIYGRLAPASWLMERDIVVGRQAMNLDQWESYSADQRQTYAAKILERIRANDMPPRQYRLMHWNAYINKADKAIIGQWARGTPAGEGTPGEAAAGEGDAARGKEVFEKRCTGCHAVEQNREGPKLRGVVGRTSGDVADFEYSPELKKARIKWDDKSLDRWLADPDSVVPGNNMAFHVGNAQERQDLIRFLHQISAN